MATKGKTSQQGESQSGAIGPGDVINPEVINPEGIASGESKPGEVKSGRVASRVEQRPVRYLDAFDSSRRGVALAGEVALSELVRLVADLPEQSGHVAWQLHGETGARGEALLRLALQTAPTVVCQRCLQPFAWPIDTEVVLQLVQSDAELDAAQISGDELESDYEKVVGSGRFDLLEQIEDELILSLPYIPRHSECQSGAAGEGDDPEPEPERRHPFAALGELKERLKKG